VNVTTKKSWFLVVRVRRSSIYWQQLGVGISWVKQINRIERWTLCNNNKVTAHQSWTHINTLTQLPINYGFNSTKSVFSTQIGRTMQHTSFLVSNDHFIISLDTSEHLHSSAVEVECLWGENKQWFFSVPSLVFVTWAQCVVQMRH
jgi:hypothetical protein